MKIATIFSEIQGFFSKCNVRGVTIFWNTLLAFLIMLSIALTLISWWLFESIVSIGDEDTQKEYKKALNMKTLNDVTAKYREKKLKFESLKH